MSMILTIRHLSGSLTGKSQRIALQEGQVVRLGRAPESDIKFSDATEDSVSGTHAELVLEGGRLFIEDKRSANGTFVNGAPCPPFQKVAVPDGSRIRLAKQGPEMQVTTAPAAATASAGVTAATSATSAATVPPPKESVGRATMLREIDRARQEERDVMAGEIAKTRKTSSLWLGVGLAAVLILAGGGIGGTFWWNQRQAAAEKQALEAKLQQQQQTIEGEKTLWSNVEKKVSPGVVYISCVYRIRIPLRTGQNVTQGDLLLADRVTGSGVVIRPGLILTAKHVVEPWRLKVKDWNNLVEKYDAKAEYDSLYIQFPGHQPLNATLVASAEDKDLSLLQIQPTGAPAVPIVKSNSAVNVTDRIAVMGYPADLGKTPQRIKNLSGFGEEWTRITQVTPTFVAGTVSQPLDSSASSGYVLFDASVTHGNSGGAVVNDRGELVGIVSAQFQQQDSIKVLGVDIPVQVPVSAGNMAVTPDHIQSFLRAHGII